MSSRTETENSCYVKSLTLMLLITTLSKQQKTDRLQPHKLQISSLTRWYQCFFKMSPAVIWTFCPEKETSEGELVRGSTSPSQVSSDVILSESCRGEQVVSKTSSTPSFNCSPLFFLSDILLSSLTFPRRLLCLFSHSLRPIFCHTLHLPHLFLPPLPSRPPSNILRSSARSKRVRLRLKIVTPKPDKKNDRKKKEKERKGGLKGVEIDPSPFSFFCSFYLLSGELFLDQAGPTRFSRARKVRLPV